jgi:hypothetical protein
MNIFFETPIDANYFCGYYDKSPVSSDGSKLIALKTNFIDHIPNRNDVAIIGYFDLDSNDRVFHKLTETNSFNWQQGCMLQWFGNKNDEIIFNKFIDNKFVSVVFNISTKIEKIFNYPIYAVSSDCKFALAIDFERHYWCRRAYSYDGVINSIKNQPVVKNDGIYKLTFLDNNLVLLISIEDILKINPVSSFAEATHYLEHIMISPNNKRFAFMHRWKSNGVIFTRLYTADLDGNNIFCLNDSGRMSHFCWINDEKLFGWGGVKTKFTKFRMTNNFAKSFFYKFILKIYKHFVKGNSDSGMSKVSSLFTNDRYILFKDKVGILNTVDHSILDRDGHPSVRPNNFQEIITDTYPDDTQSQQLILYNLNTGSKKIIDNIPTTPIYNFSPNRCDLHPKWSFDGKFVSIDTLINGNRGVKIYKISNEY